MNKTEEQTLLSLPFPLTLSFAKETSSTNDDVKDAARNGAPDYLVRIADRQTAGKGKPGRSFYSEGGLYMSVLLPAREKALPFVTTIAAIAVCRAVNELTGKRALIKWVNDVYVDGKKVCGILSESVVTEKERRVIVGIGVNLCHSENAFPEEIKDIAGSVDADRTELAARILLHLFSLYDLSDPGALRKEYRALSFLLGKTVVVEKENDRREAIALGFTSTLALTVRYADGSTEDLLAGDVSIRSDDKSR